MRVRTLPGLSGGLALAGVMLLGACSSAVGGDASVLLLDREVMTLDGGASEPFTVDVPEDTVSVTVTVEGERGGSYAVESWLDEDGLAIVAPGWSEAEPGLCLSCANRIAASDAAFGALAPNNPSVEIRPGKHTLVAAGWETPDLFTRRPMDGEVRVSVHAKVLPEVPSRGVIDFNFYFTGARGWTAAKAQRDRDFLSMLKKAEDILAQSGIRIGQRTFHDIDSRFDYIESVFGEDSELLDLFEQGAATAEHGVNIFFVEEFRTGFGGILLGIAGGIPGPGVMGTLRSGVAVMADLPEGEAMGTLGRTLVHEVGHFLGLFHNSEYQMFEDMPQIHDPLPDTPQNDPTYLMNAWGHGERMSEWQGRVMRLNRWVRHPGSTP